MSDYQHRSPEFFLDDINTDVSQVLNETAEIKRLLVTLVDVAQKSFESTNRLLDGMRELLNIENECAVFVREVAKGRDTAARIARERDLTEMFTTLFIASGHIDHFNEYLSTKDEYILSKIEAAMIRINAHVIKEVQERDKAKQGTARLVREDVTQW